MSDRPGLVYVICNAAWPGWTKVGHVLGSGYNATRAMQKRVSNYNVADPHKRFIISNSYYASCALVAEHYAHELLGIKYRRGDGEWFYCSVDEAQRIVARVCQIARLRPADRSQHFNAVLEEERHQMADQDDTQKLLAEVVEIAAQHQDRLDPEEVAHIANAAYEMIEVLLREVQEADDYATSDHTRNIAVAAEVILRRLATLRRLS